MWPDLTQQGQSVKQNLQFFISETGVVPFWGDLLLGSSQVSHRLLAVLFPEQAFRQRWCAGADFLDRREQTCFTLFFRHGLLYRRIFGTYGEL